MIRVTQDGTGFVDGVTGDRFVPLGVNYAATIGPRLQPDGATRRIFPLFGRDAMTEPDGLDEAVRMLDAIAALVLHCSSIVG